MNVSTLSFETSRPQKKRKKKKPTRLKMPRKKRKEDSMSNNFEFTLYYNNVRGDFRNVSYPNVMTVHNSEELCKVVACDHVCAEYKDNRRKNENFIQANCTMFDVDNTETDDPKEWIWPTDVQTDFPNVPFYVSYSRNHMKIKDGKAPRPKFHVYFPDVMINNGEEYSKHKQEVISYFPAFDANAKDSARFFIGVENPYVNYYNGEVLLMNFIKTVQVEKPHEQAVADPVKSADIIPQGQRNNTMYRYACRILVRLRDTDRAYQDFIRESANCTPPLDEKELDSVWNSALKFYEKKIQAESNNVSSDSEEWNNPVPFQTVNTPDFPTDSLPASMASFVKALAESTQTPEEMGGILSLGILATAFQSRYEVEITPDWTEPLCLYTLAIAQPAERKSAVISKLTTPLYEYENMRQEDERKEVAQNRAERDMLEKALEQKKKEASKETKNLNACHKDVLSLSAKLAEFEDKHPFRLLVDDTTTEKLVDMLNKQKSCITVASAEGGIFGTMAGRYDKSTNFDVYLKGHAGDPISVDRIGREPNYIKHPRLTMILTIQPNVLNGLMSNEDFRGRGLCGRFLYSVCKSRIGSRNVDPKPIPEQVKEEYRAFIQRILSQEDSGTIHLSVEARKVQLEYAARVEKKLGNEWEPIQDWAGKLVGAMVRIAALIHAAEQKNPTEIPITTETMAAAVDIAEYLGIHAMVAYQVMGLDKDYQNAKYLFEKIKKIGQDEITKSGLFDICKGKFLKVETMEPALRILADMNYIKMIDNRTGKKGRPGQKIIVNPSIKNSKNSEKEE